LEDGLRCSGRALELLLLSLTRSLSLSGEAGEKGALRWGCVNVVDVVNVVRRSARPGSPLARPTSPAASTRRRPPLLPLLPRRSLSRYGLHALAPLAPRRLILATCAAPGACPLGPARAPPARRVVVPVRKGRQPAAAAVPQPRRVRDDSKRGRSPGRVSTLSLSLSCEMSRLGWSIGGARGGGAGSLELRRVPRPAWPTSRG
jgi:hypothetical protein